jgi:hypothetical protein
VSGRSRSCLISEGILGAMRGAARCPPEERLEERRALRSSVTLGESSLPSQAVSTLLRRGRRALPLTTLG